ncbi:MAG: hypothetical protein V7K50_12010 [Nostoc sp.]|uniref:hypothetical protein n=1 Tax=Nostoc sp. TaxID=1180 RepID=UPI002FF90B26
MLTIVNIFCNCLTQQKSSVTRTKQVGYFGFMREVGDVYNRLFDDEIGSAKGLLIEI